MDDQELNNDNPQQRNWQGIGIAILVIVIICSMITTAILLLNPEKSHSDSIKTLLTIDDIIDPTVTLEDSGATWITDSKFAYKDENGTIWSVQIESDSTLRKQILLSEDVYTRDKEPDSWYLSPSGKFVALEYITKKLWDKSVYKNVQISTVNTLPYETVFKGNKLRLFKWSSNTKTDCFVYANFDNNLFYQCNPNPAESKSVQITYTGSDSVLNGVTDSTYENIFTKNEAVWISPKSKKVAYAVFDETGVSKVYANSKHDENDGDYSRPAFYAKVAETLPTVNLNVWLFESNRTIKLIPPQEVLNLGNDRYLIHVKWIESNFSDSFDQEEILICIWTNRVQNASYFTSCLISPSFDVVNCKLDYMHNYNGFWMEPENLNVHYAMSDRYFVILPTALKDGYYYKHVAKLTPRISQPAAIYITHDIYDVSQIVGYSAERNTIYFLASIESPIHRHLYSIQIGQSKPVCLSCSIVVNNNTCNYVSAKFSQNGKYYLLKCLGPGVPKLLLKSTVENNTLMIIENNTVYQQYISRKALPVVKYANYETAKGYKSYTKILFPPGVQDSPSDANAIPLILKISNNPGIQSVTTRWDVSFDTYLSTTKRFMIVYVDGRGTVGKGSKYITPIYRNLATFDVQDQIKSVKLLVNTSWSIDPTHMAVWGQEYGGFLAGHVIKIDAFRTLKCAALVSPLTNLKLFSAPFIERFMGLNSTFDNYDNYQKSNLLKNVTSFGNGKLLIIQEDNWYHANVKQLVQLLIEKNIQFQFMVYPYPSEKKLENSNLKHRLTLLDNFFTECLTVRKARVEDEH